MTILFVLEHYRPYIGGAEKLFAELAEALHIKGHSVIVITTRHDRCLPKLEQIKGVSIHRINCFNRYFFTFFSLPAILRLARKTDIIHTTSYNAALPAWLGAKLSSKPAIITFHEVWGKLWQQLPFATSIEKTGFYLYEKMILKLNFDHFIAVSHFTRKALINQGIPAGRVSTIYNGLDYQQFEHYPHQAPAHFTFTYFGRLGISKGLDLLIPAAAAFCKTHPGSIFRMIIPNTPARTYRQVMELVEKYQLAAHLELLHNLSKDMLCQKISRSSCVVIPSYSEGFCFVAAEAMAMGVPVISSGRGALKEVVNAQHIQLKEHSVEGLLAALKKAKAEEWSVLKSKKFTLSQAVQRYLQMYRKLGRTKT